ncbi:hypothetical protein ECDEC14C_3485 [Escherichia coli DEC14C]|nr:hypothetical protein ECDEC14C_3485 [Escherichia coli DEC14C]
MPVSRYLCIFINVGLGEARYVIQRGANVNGAWIRWSDGAIEVFGTGGSNDNGLAKVVYPIALPKLSRFISIAERIRTDYEATPNNVHVSMIVDDQVSNTGFYVRCQMYDGRPSTSAFPGEFIVRLFNPVTLTEVIPGLHDVTGAVELPEDNWFFTASEIPEGMEISVNEKGEPILIEIKPSQVELAR